MKVVVNGREETLEGEMTLLDYLQKKNIRPEIVAIELNKEIIDKTLYKDTAVKENDVLEILHFIGGG
ncbi:MAG: sulfur carrier protein ThiS [Candidatus Margulisiibacteriota bacterium]